MDPDDAKEAISVLCDALVDEGTPSPWGAAALSAASAAAVSAEQSPAMHLELPLAALPDVDQEEAASWQTSRRGESPRSVTGAAGIANIRRGRHSLKLVHLMEASVNARAGSASSPPPASPDAGDRPCGSLIPCASPFFPSASPTVERLDVRAKRLLWPCTPRSLSSPVRAPTAAGLAAAVGPAAAAEPRAEALATYAFVVEAGQDEEVESDEVASSSAEEGWSGACSSASTKAADQSALPPSKLVQKCLSPTPPATGKVASPLRRRCVSVPNRDTAEVNAIVLPTQESV